MKLHVVMDLVHDKSLFGRKAIMPSPSTFLLLLAEPV
jgi:hypothetical protein